MNKIILSGLIGLGLIACQGNASKTEAPAVEVKENCNYKVINDSTKFQWTAYKTTDKIPVKGTFDKIEIAVLMDMDNSSPKKAMENLGFSIPVNSINSNNPERDAKLINTFFGSMDNTQKLSGFVESIEGTETNGSVNIKIEMNGIKENFTGSYMVTGNKADVVGSLDVNNWKGEAAIDALNVLCKDLHKGVDGISKTWSEVGISFTIEFAKDCQ